MEQFALKVNDGHCVVHEGMQTVTPFMAAMLVKHCNYERNRNIAKTHVDELVSLMNSGKWIEGHTIYFADLNGEKILVDGQHRLVAVSMQNKPHTFYFSIIPVKNKDDVHDMFCSFDVAIRKRSVMDILNSANFHKEAGLSKTTSNKLFAAAYLAENGLRRVHYTQDVKHGDASYRIGISFKWAKEACLYEEALLQADKNLKNKMMADGVFAVALLTYRWQVSMARAFWEGVASGDGLKKGDPRRTFERDLRNRDFNANSREQGEKAASLAWNAFYENRTLKIIKVHADRDVPLLGVKFL